MTNLVKKKRLVIVFPAYNKATSIRASLQCIAEQTFQDFEAIILENRSTDGTLAEAEAFCETDPRFSVIRNETHLDVLDAFAKAIRIGSQRGRYFCLRACDDLSSRDFLERLVTVLDVYPDKLLAACPTRLIGNNIRMKTPHPHTFNFLSSYCKGRIPRNLTFPAEWIYGVFRAEAGELMLARWYEYGYPWCQSSFIISELVVRGFVQYIEGPTFDFVEGAGSKKLFAQHGFLKKLRHRFNYTFGIYRLHKKLPKVNFRTRLLFLRMCWNDSRRKTQFKLLWIL